MKKPPLVALAALAWALSGVPAAAEQARFPVTLPNCPTPLLLEAPGIFSSAENEQHILDHLASNTARKGTYVLSLSAPAAPDVHLLVLKLGTTKEIQGRVTQAQFDEVRAFLMQHDASELARNHEYAKQPAAGVASGKVEIKGTNFYSVSADEQEVVLLGLNRASANDVEAINYTAQKFGYAQKCIVQVSMFAPVSSMPIEAFEALVPDLSVR